MPEEQTQEQQSHPTTKMMGAAIHTEATDHNTTKPTDSGELIAGKYKTQEDLVKAYKELERKLGQQSNPSDTKSDTQEDTREDTQEAQSDAPDSDQGADEGADPSAVVDAAQDALKGSGVDVSLDDLKAEYQANGELSADTRKKLNDAGISDVVIDANIQAMSYAFDKFNSKVFDLVGGEEGWNTLNAWMGANLDDADKATLNKALNAADYALTKRLLAGIQAEYKAAVGEVGSRVSGKGQGSVGIEIDWDATTYQSAQESHHKAINDRRYGRDQMYTAAVDQLIRDKINKFGAGGKIVNGSR